LSIHFSISFFLVWIFSLISSDLVVALSIYIC
jgi:hypothetical protein